MYAAYFANASKANMKFENGNMTCLTCHYAHGTSQDLWNATLDNTFFEAPYVELAGSSALKRAPNMGTCEACHGKKEGAEGYSANTGQTDVHGETTQTDNGQAGAKFVGSAKCVECHASYAEGFKETYHNNMATYYNIDKNTAVTERAYRGSDALLRVFMENPSLKTTAPYSNIWSKLDTDNDGTPDITSTLDVLLWGKPDEAAYVAVYNNADGKYYRYVELEKSESGVYELFMYHIRVLHYVLHRATL
jgi:hypothetical protein